MSRWSLLGITFLLLASGCQSAFRIPPENFPKKITAVATARSEHDVAQNLLDIAREHKALVVIFWQIECPCVRRYQTRVNSLYQRYKNQDIAFMHLSSNSNESFREVTYEYHKRQIPLPIFRDEGGLIAEILGAKGTPTAAIINKEGALVFLGWIDNERYENEKMRIAYLENALIEVINNQPISTPTSPMFGCLIH